MRALSALLVVSMALPALAQARVRVSPFTVAGERSEALGFFGPEVARAVGEALAARGVEVGAPDERDERDPAGDAGETGVNGRVETLSGGDRVRLSATVRGRTVAVDGPFDSIDRLAADLAQRLAPLLASAEPEHASPRIAAARSTRSPRALAKEKEEDRAPPAELARAPEPSAPAASPEPSAPAASTVPSTPAPPKPAESPAQPSAVPQPAAAVPDLGPAPSEAPHPAEAAAPAPAAPAASDPPPPAPIAQDPPAVPAPPAQTMRRPPVYYPPRYPYGFRRNFVVAHTIPDIPAAFRGTGAAATQAFYAFLRQRLHIQYVPTGVGLVPLAAAVDEGLRVGARAVVMARLLGVEYLPVRSGQSVRCRLEVVVVRDGRPVLRRVVESEPTDPGPPGLRRGRDYDPIFMAVYQALDSVGPELDLALASLR